MSKNKKLLYIYLFLSIIFFIIIFSFWCFLPFKKNIKIENVNVVNSVRRVENTQKYNNFIESEDKDVSMLFVGDVMLDRHVKEKIDLYGLDYLFEKISSSSPDFFNNYDLVSANLEGAVTNDGEHYNPINIYDFAFSPIDVVDLKKYNFNFFNLANNHFFDQGERGIIETRDILEESDFLYVGCKDKVVDDCSSASLEINKKKIGILGFSMVYGVFDLFQAQEKIRESVAQSDFVIVQVHWGKEYDHIFNSVQEYTAKALIDAGADLIIGHHPHVVQGMEIYKNKAIFYSLGNFIFDQYFSFDTQEELAVSLKIKDDIQEFNLFPLRSNSSQPNLMTKEETNKFFDRFISWSKINEDIKTQIKNNKIILRNEK